VELYFKRKGDEMSECKHLMNPETCISCEDEMNTEKREKDLIKEEKIKVKKIDHKKALNFVAEYINYDMQSKDRLSEIQWLLEQVYQGADLLNIPIEHIVDDWDLDDTEQWGDDIDIYKEEEE
tara:strand:- start:419 stop:787 length:369 start_codon:yes stop_codon:yes gene_type:complete